MKCIARIVGKSGYEVGKMNMSSEAYHQELFPLQSKKTLTTLFCNGRLMTFISWPNKRYRPSIFLSRAHLKPYCGMQCRTNMGSGVHNQIQLSFPLHF